MILDSEEQKQELLSLLSIVPFQGNIAQGIDKLMDKVRQLMVLIQMAKIEEKK